ncbi:MAG TPA: lysylphosphatidylglycerol synthase domain-containing protein [Roseiarcus sp.]|nr:lysylphosphatidylglycerol synthase domain-containing protein [Roseiarcus sp.]
MAETQERRPASNWAPGSASRPPDPPQFLARVILMLRRRRRTLRRLGVAASFLIIAVSATIFVRTLLRIDVNKFKAAIAATGGDQITLAFAFTALSYLALTGYDGLALRHLGIKVPYWLTALASFASYAVSFTLGFPLVTGGAIRYWLYAPAGLTAGKVASLTVVAGVTFWLGMGSIVGVGFMTASDAVAEINHFNPLANRLIGLSVLVALIVYLVWVGSMRWRDSAIVGTFKLPGPLVTLGQMALGVADVCSASAALYFLLPKGSTIGFPTFATLYSLAAMLGIASHSPGGLGVFEVTILQGVGGDSDALLASLLLFRGIYYVAPFIGAMALLGGVEATRRWRSIREAMTAPSDE